MQGSTLERSQASGPTTTQTNPTDTANSTAGYGKEAYPNMSRMDWAVELYMVGSITTSRASARNQRQWCKCKRTMGDGTWRTTWPPADVMWDMHTIDTTWGDLGTVSGVGSSGSHWRARRSSDETHISGLPTLHLGCHDTSLQRRSNLCNALRRHGRPAPWPRHHGHSLPRRWV